MAFVQLNMQTCRVIVGYCFRFHFSPHARVFEAKESLHTKRSSWHNQAIYLQVLEFHSECDLSYCDV